MPRMKSLFVSECYKGKQLFLKDKTGCFWAGDFLNKLN
jgi:hypothetical protein